MLLKLLRAAASKRTSSGVSAGREPRQRFETSRDRDSKPSDFPYLKSSGCLYLWPPGNIRLRRSSAAFIAGIRVNWLGFLF